MQQIFRYISYLALMLMGAFLLSQAIINPSPRIVKGALVCLGIVFFAYARQEHIVYVALFIAFFPRHLSGVYNTSDGIILILSFFLFLRSNVERRSVISIEKIIHNPFFQPSLLILCCYLFSWILAWGNNANGMNHHTKFLVGIFYALLFSNLLIGFVQDKRRSLNIQFLLLFLLVLNLMIGLISWTNPNLSIVKTAIQIATGEAGAGTVFVGNGSDYAMRLGGLIYFWEEYAEYLMTATILLFGLCISGGAQKPLLIAGLGSVLLLSSFELLLTNTRGSTILVVFGIIIIVFFYSPLKFNNRLFLAVGIILFGLLSLFLAQSSGQFTLLDRFSTFTQIQKTEFGYLPVGRVEVWKLTLRHIAEHGITGSGPSFYPLTRYGGCFGILLWPHNIILIILSTIGVLGLGAYAFLFLRFIQLQKILGEIKNKSQHLFFRSLWLALSIFLIDTMKFDGFLRDKRSYFYLMWIMIAYMFSVVNLREDDE